MKLLGKAILAALIAVMIGGTIALASGGSAIPAPLRTAVDVKGPCDEAAHANVARCDGAQVPEDSSPVHQGGGGDDSGQSGEMQTGDDSGSDEVEAGDDSSRSGPDDSGASGSDSDSGNSGRDHSEDD